MKILRKLKMVDDNVLDVRNNIRSEILLTRKAILYWTELAIKSVMEGDGTSLTRQLGEAVDELNSLLREVKSKEKIISWKAK